MTDDQSIRSIALDYIEGWYSADSERMDRSLSPHLAKRRIVSHDEIWHVDKPWMVQATSAGKGRIDEPSKGKKVITILDRTATMASVKIVSENFIDYLHLVKSDGKRSIVNALWDYHAQQSHGYRKRPANLSTSRTQALPGNCRGSVDDEPVQWTS